MDCCALASSRHQPTCGLLHGIQVVIRVQLLHSDGVHLPLRRPLKQSPNLFQVENNKMSPDVKGLFLGVRFVSSRVIIISWLGCSSRTSCLSRRGVV